MVGKLYTVEPPLKMEENKVSSPLQCHNSKENNDTILIAGVSHKFPCLSQFHWKVELLCNAFHFTDIFQRYCFAPSSFGNTFNRLTCSGTSSSSTQTPTSTTSSSSTSTTTGGNSVCNSKACQALSQSMVSMMNTSVDPCNDFYRFSCGAAKESVAMKMEKLMGERLKILFDDPPKQLDPWQQSLVSFYKSCKSR